jgi:hypothetical protein
MRKAVQDRMKAVKDDKSLSGKPRLLKNNPLPPAFKLYFPNGGETLTSGQTVNVSWSPFWKGVRTVKLEYSNGSMWKVITNSTTHNGTFTWQVPAISSKTVTLRVSTADGKVFDESDKQFSISPSP